MGIYLDNHATTPVDPRVARIISRHMVGAFGNANSTDHDFGDRARKAISIARSQLSDLVKSGHSQIIFTSGATQSIFLAFNGFVQALRNAGLRRRVRILSLSVEHRAVLKVCHNLVQSGNVDHKLIPVDRRGRIDLDQLSTLAKNADLVSVMAANNEVGNIYPIKQASDIAQASGAFFFTDATQTVGHEPMDFIGYGIDALALSGHKFYGPQGVGALIISDRFPASISYMKELRNIGTPNLPGIAGLGHAAYLRQEEMSVDEERVGRLKNYMRDELLRRVDKIVINGDPEDSLAGNLHFSCPGAPNQAVTARLQPKVALSTTSACSKGVDGPSHVLQAMGLPRDISESALRLGLGKFTTEGEVEEGISLIVTALQNIRPSVVRTA